MSFRRNKKPSLNKENQPSSKTRTPLKISDLSEKTIGEIWEGKTDIKGVAPHTFRKIRKEVLSRENDGWLSDEELNF